MDPRSERIIVKYRQSTPAAARRSLRADASGALVRTLPGTGAEVLRLPPGADPRAAARLLERDARVLYATPDVLRRVDTADPRFPQQWGLSNTGQTVEGRAGVSTIDTRATSAWTTTVGNASTLIAVIDTGIDIEHPDLAGAIWTNAAESGTRATNGLDDDDNGYVDDVHGWDFANGDASVFDLSDGDEHGTHVAGTIAATANNNIGGAGVAYGVTILPLKFLGPNGGYDSDAIEAIAYARARGAKVINASWGSSQSDGYADSAALRDAIASCGCTFVAAAGNDAGNNDIRNGANYPASFDLPNIVSVAAMDNRGALASFSAYGATTVDVAAPGVSILSTVPRRRAGVAAVHVSPGSYTAQHWGFGLEDIATAARRADLLDRALGALGTAKADPVLLVADDEADTIAGQSSFYTTALSSLGFTNVTTISVPTGANGPSAATMSGKTVIWETGLSYGPDDGSFGPLRANDRSALTTFLDGGGKLLLAGADAIYLSEASSFVRDRLKITFLREEGAQTVLSGIAAPYNGQSYTASSADSSWGQIVGKPNPYRDIVEVRSAGATAVLQYAGDPNYDNAYDYYMGTSMAAPHVSGVAALLLSRWPSLGGSALADRINVTAQPASGLTGKVASGGFADAALAVGNEPSPPPTVGARVVNGNLWVSWAASTGPFGPVAASGGYQVQLVKDGTPVGGWIAFDAPGEYAMRDVPGGGTYAVRVRALGTSAATLPRQSAASAVMASGGVPNQVSGVAVTYTTGTPVLSWTEPATNGSGILTYEVCASGGACRTLTGSLAGAPATSLSWATPPAELSVRAINSYGIGAWSPAVAMAAYLLPGAPVNVMATADDESAVVSWQASSGQPVPTDAVITVEPEGRQIVVSGTSTRVTGLTNGATYTFSVRSTNAAGASAAAVSAAVAPRDVTPPAAATSVAVSTGQARADLRWTNPATSDFSGVSVRVLEGTAVPGPSDGSEIYRGTGTAAATSLLPGRAYTVAIYAYDEASNYSPAAVAVVHGSSLSRSVSRRSVVYGGWTTHRTTLTGTATSDAIPGKTVRLMQRRTGTFAWTTACTRTTSSAGVATCSMKPLRNTQYQWRFAAGGLTTAAASASYVVLVRPKVTAHVSDSTVRSGTSVRVSGSVAPRHARQKVYLQRYYGGAWRTISRATLSSTSTYTFRFRPTLRGISKYRIYKTGDGKHGYGVSPTRQISVG